MSPHALSLFGLSLLVACSSRTPTSVGPRQATPPDAPVVTAPTPPVMAPIEVAATVESKPQFQSPIALGRLTIFPVTLPANAQDDPGPLMLLDEALERGLAEVREIGTDDTAAAIPEPIQIQRRADNLENQDLWQRNHLDHPNVQIQGRGIAGGAVVNTLIIENKSDIPIFVLAGTVVRGGKQDRQIGQDFVVDAKQTTPVDAFCIERGRWTMEREGQETGGRFTTVSSLANAKVRAAGQYAKDQSAVWDNVAQVNKAHAKHVASDTLLATLESPEVEAQIGRRAGEILQALRGATPQIELVGFAWAIDGHIQGVRHFAHTKVFGLVADKLTRAVAADLGTAEAQGQAAAFESPTVADVERFVAEVAKAAEVRHDTHAANENVYQESGVAWGSKTELKAKPGKKARAIAWDYLAK